MQIFETKRLVLREATLADADFILKLLNAPKYIQHIADRNVRSIEGAENYIKERLLKGYVDLGFGFWLVVRKDTGETIGTCGLTKRPILEHADIGYAFLPEGEGQGFAFEAATATMHYIEKTLQFSSISAIVSADNVRSIRLLEKIGLERQGMIPYEGEEVLLFLKEF